MNLQQLLKSTINNLPEIEWDEISDNNDDEDIEWVNREVCVYILTFYSVQLIEAETNSNHFSSNNLNRENVFDQEPIEDTHIEIIHENRFPVIPQLDAEEQFQKMFSLATEAVEQTVNRISESHAEPEFDDKNIFVEETDSRAFSSFLPTYTPSINHTLQDIDLDALLFQVQTNPENYCLNQNRLQVAQSILFDTKVSVELQVNLSTNAENTEKCSISDTKSVSEVVESTSNSSTESLFLPGNQVPTRFVDLRENQVILEC